jgi:subtilisin family serine protease
VRLRCRRPAFLAGLLACLGLCAACAGPLDVPALAAVGVGDDQRHQVDEEIAARGRTVVLVVLRDDPATAAKRGANAPALAKHDPAHLRVRRRATTVPIAIADLDREGLTALRADPDVVSVWPDQPMHAALAQSVPLIRADQLVAATGHDGANVTVAVLDTGVNQSHVDLAPALVGSGFHSLAQGSDAGPGGADDDLGHGSNVAGIIASRGLAPGSHVGVAPATHIFAVKVLTADGSGWLSDWIAGLDYVTAHRDDVSPPIRVVNMSLVSAAATGNCPCDDDSHAQFIPFAAAAAAAKAAGLALFASSGNRGLTSAMTAPACLSSVMAVGATYDEDLGPQPDQGTYQSSLGREFADCADATTAGAALACFTDRDPCLKLVAPGAAITSDFAGSTTALATYEGTSQAAPHAAGVAAQLLSAYPTLSVDRVYAALLASGRPRVPDPLLPGASYAFLDAVDADAAARCSLACIPEGPCDQAVCDGAGTCTHPPAAPGAVCATRCAAGTALASVCDAQGACLQQPPRACAPYACEAAGDTCAEVCAADADCAPGMTCQAGACATPPEPGGCSVAPAGRAPCGPLPWATLAAGVAAAIRRRRPLGSWGSIHADGSRGQAAHVPQLQEAGERPHHPGCRGAHVSLPQLQEDPDGEGRVEGRVERTQEGRLEAGVAARPPPWRKNGVR